ncbi:MAG: hypothetical protein ACJ72E_13605 [Marmoricola sp.]
MRRPVIWALAAAAPLLGLTGCSGSVGHGAIRSAEGSITGLTVAGPVGSAPSVRMAAPLKVGSTQTAVITAGTGAPVQIDQLFVLQLSLYDARTGRLALSTYQHGVQPVVAKSSDDSLFPALTKALIGLREGSRVALALTPADAYGSGGVPPAGVRAEDPVVVVADVVAVPPVDVAPAITLPTPYPTAPDAPGDPVVRMAGSLPVGVDFRHADRPDPGAITTIHEVDGTGPVVRQHSLVTVRFLGQVFGHTEPFADSYFKDPQLVPVAAEGSVTSWDYALVGLHQGSRVVVIGPAGPPGVATAPGIGKDDTIAWVIDVLGVS